MPTAAVSLQSSQTTISATSCGQIVAYQVTIHGQIALTQSGCAGVGLSDPPDPTGGFQLVQ